MKPIEKIRVAVLYGGRSSEHEVSLRSAANVIEYLDKSLFDIIPMGIDKQGNWFLGRDIFDKSLKNFTIPTMLDQPHAWFTPEWVGKSIEKQQVNEIVPKNRQNGRLFDVIFPIVHGTYCEDGTLQGLLELADIPYVGCGVLSSAMGMDKDISKRLAIHAGIPTAPYIAFKYDQWQGDPQHYCKEIIEKIGLPVFVKPANTGSSVGINKVKTIEQLSSAIDQAFSFDTKVLVEKALNVFELEVAVLEALKPNTDPVVSVVGEIKPNHEFYSYDAKYLDEHGAELFIPAPVSEEIQQRARTMAKDIFKSLECEGMARVDLFLEKDTGKLYFNEINTIPGFTHVSMYPKLMAATGISYADLLTHLVQLAISRHKIKSRLIRSYAHA
jgi:D-alanine-D-alanine ligase